MVRRTAKNTPARKRGRGNISLQPTGPEFREMVATYLGAPSPLATALGVGRPVRSARRSQGSLLLDPWGFALTAHLQSKMRSIASMLPIVRHAHRRRGRSFALGTRPFAGRLDVPRLLDA